MFKRILVSLFLINLVFTFSACTKKGSEQPNGTNVVSPEKIDEVNGQGAIFTEEEKKILDEQEYRQQAEAYNWIKSSEVAKHNTKNDCWMIVNDRVYDVTKYINTHPGGPAILAGCGKNATEMFFKQSDGTAHSEKAQSMLEKYYIGDRDMEE